MKIFELSQIGEFHVNHNEDFKVVEDAGKHYKLIAVMDGCSSGTDSHLASTLIGKILRKLAKQEAYREYATEQPTPIKELVESLALSLFSDLQMLNNQLDLASDEILSTIILGVVDTKNRQAELIIAGDGVIHVDGQTIEYENDNKPDYIGYHLKMDKHLWLQTRTHRKSIPRFTDLSISTDGVHTFKNFDGKSYNKIESGSILHEFLESRQFEENENKLKKTMLKMEEEFGLKPSDDLTIIRVILSD
ncbi:MAG: protein phosphatase 2C domain-containing protein [Saprospiraceae bacterium]